MPFVIEYMHVVHVYSMYTQYICIKAACVYIYMYMHACNMHVHAHAQMVGLA